MRRLKLLFYLFVVNSLFLINNAEAQNQKPLSGTGCLSGGKIYYSYIETIFQYNGSTVTGFRYRYNSNLSYDAYANCAPGDTKSYYRLGSTAQQPSPNTNSNTNIGCGFGTTYDTANSGTMYYFTVVNCPLDESAYVLLAAISIVGIYFIRQRKNYQPII
nr:hypothetical protein [Pedobacter sp. ASV2]